jgi:hypothetical protein
VPRLWQPARAGCDHLRQVCRPSPCSRGSGSSGAEVSRAEEAEKKSPLLSARELKALPVLATGKQKIKECVERRASSVEWVGTLLTADPSLPYPALLRRVRV